MPMPLPCVTRRKNSKNINPKIAPITRPAQIFPGTLKMLPSGPMSEPVPLGDTARKIPTGNGENAERDVQFVGYDACPYVDHRYKKQYQKRETPKAREETMMNIPAPANPPFATGPEQTAIPMMNSTIGYCTLSRALQRRHGRPAERNSGAGSARTTERSPARRAMGAAADNTRVEDEMATIVSQGNDVQKAAYHEAENKKKENGP